MIKMKICVGNLKGGVGKTTTAVHLALGLSRSGRTLLVDADPEQPQCYEWSETAGEDWPAAQCIVLHLPTRDLAKKAGPMLADYEHIVFDVGPKNPSLLRQALMLSDDLIIPVRPSTAELHEVPKTVELAAEVDELHPLRATVLLVQVRSGTRTAAEARGLLDELGVPVFETEIRLLERYGLSFGSVPPELGDYERVLTELTQEVTA
ncbi:AAA family ATPase [Pseudonocardia broussonetiae]|uniref:AAA family ATPase n=1 Tax=Pseudonocardia broussonetiae TaxID=2736640 RepID=A0A6M6JVY0_9PSEU|nr:AAA family ATPase [Pseudonocardia broussonetiae]QJY51203.1 AAA family ATPase [Pseudonocardia broussonetiae]QJY51217.1 AAA family ATPase [Pseudonocardia broussonetiae]